MRRDEILEALKGEAKLWPYAAALKGMSVETEDKVSRAAAPRYWTIGVDKIPASQRKRRRQAAGRPTVAMVIQQPDTHVRRAIQSRPGQSQRRPSLQKKLKVDAITEAMGASANKVELSYCVQ